MRAGRLTWEEGFEHIGGEVRKQMDLHVTIGRGSDEESVSEEPFVQATAFSLLGLHSSVALLPTPSVRTLT